MNKQATCLRCKSR